MSRNSRFVRTAVARYWWLAVALVAGPAAQAQQDTFTPRVETTAEWDSNRLLLINHPQTGEWFQALLSEDWTRQTGRSELEVRPQVTLQDSTLKTIDAYEALLNVRGSYVTLKSAYTLVAEYHRQDSYNSEYGVANFNPLNPNAPATVGSGYLVTGVTRSSYQIAPGMTHTFTERFSSELDPAFLAVRYSSQVPEELVNFNAPSLDINGVWALSQRGQVAIGPYYHEYDPSDPLAEGVFKSRSFGANLSYRYLTTKLTNSVVTLKLGRDEQDQFPLPGGGGGTGRVGTNTWGLEWKGNYSWQTSHLQFAVGRFLEPSSIGGEIGLYQIRGQFSHVFSQTLSAAISARITREQGLGAERDTIGTRDRGYGEASLTKALSREFYLSGGYRWLLQSLPTQNAAGNLVRGPTAQNNGVYLTIGWHPIESR